MAIWHLESYGSYNFVLTRVFTLNAKATSLRQISQKAVCVWGMLHFGGHSPHAPAILWWKLCLLGMCCSLIEGSFTLSTTKSSS